MERERRQRSNSNEAGKGRQGSMERDRPRTARSSLMGVSVQRAPDFRTEKNKNIQELLSFITEWDIENPERFTQKTLVCPSTKVFLDIFKFLIGLLMPGHILADRHEEEIPYIFKSLGYPYIITRSAVLSIAPHTWPQLCHALVWLCRSIAEVPTIEVEPSDFLGYVLDVSCHPEQEAKFEAEIKKTYMEAHKLTKISLEQQLDGHIRKREQFENQIGDAQDLLDNIEKMEQNLASMEQYLEATDKYLEPKQLQIDELEASVVSLATLLAEKQSRREKLESENNKRMAEMTSEERAEMKARYQQLVESKNMCSLEIEEINKKQWANEIKLSQGLKELDDLCRKFNHLAADNMSQDVSDKLLLSVKESVSDKVSSVVEPYLEKTNNHLANDDELREKLAYREQLNSKLLNHKTEIDDERRHFQLTQGEHGSILESLTSHCEAAKEKNEVTNKKVQSLAKQRDGLISENEKLMEELAFSAERSEKLKESTQREEREDVIKLNKQMAKYDEAVISKQQKFHTQKLALEDMKRTLQLLKMELNNVLLMQTEFKNRKY